jgi:hypothetical protein
VWWFWGAVQHVFTLAVAAAQGEPRCTAEAQEIVFLSQFDVVCRLW